MERVSTREVPEEPQGRDTEAGYPAPRRAAARQWRARMDLVDLRAHLLNGQDRALLQMYLEAGRNFHEIARLVGLSPSTVCRRIHRMIRRLSDPTYTVCLRHQRHFSSVELDVIRDRFVRGLSLVSLGRRHALGHRRIRRIVTKARQMARALAAV